MRLLAKRLVTALRLNNLITITIIYLKNSTDFRQILVDLVEFFIYTNIVRSGYERFGII